MLTLQAGVRLAEGMYQPLSEPVEAWYFDMACPPQDSGRRTLDIAFTADGICNAVVFWYELHLAEGITSPLHPSRPAVPPRKVSTCFSSVPYKHFSG